MTRKGPLPAPRKQSNVSLEEAIHNRYSCRAFKDSPISEPELSQLLWAGQGLRGSGYRNAPSAGALYPLELYVINHEGIFHYQPRDHSIQAIQDGDSRKDLALAALDQEFIEQAALSIVICTVPMRTIQKYGIERSPRYIDMEVGHVGQNIMLQAVGMGLASVPVGAFYDDQIAALLDLSEDVQPRYIITIGEPQETS
jgi:SagB-type dehydrogenase family enzyme